MEAEIEKLTQESSTEQPPSPQCHSVTMSQESSAGLKEEQGSVQEKQASQGAEEEEDPTHEHVKQEEEASAVGTRPPLSAPEVHSA